MNQCNLENWFLKYPLTQWAYSRAIYQTKQQDFSRYIPTIFQRSTPSLALTNSITPLQASNLTLPYILTLERGYNRVYSMAIWLWCDKMQSSFMKQRPLMKLSLLHSAPRTEPHKLPDKGPLLFATSRKRKLPSWSQFHFTVTVLQEKGIAVINGTSLNLGTTCLSLPSACIQLPV